MVYLYGALALVLSLFTLIFLKIAFRGKRVYHNVAAVIAVSVAPFAGYYVVAFFLELIKSLNFD